MAPLNDYNVRYACHEYNARYKHDTDSQAKIKP